MDIQSRIVLGSEGVRFYAERGAKLHRFDGSENDSHYGFRLRSIDVPWLRRLLLSGFVEKAEFPVNDISLVKGDLNDLTRLVVYAMLYGHFRSSINSRVINTDVIQRWNRQHPHQALDARNASSSLELRQALLAHPDALQEIKRSIAMPVLRTLSADGRLNAEDRTRLNRFAIDLINNLDPLVFFVLLGSQPAERRSIESDIQKALMSCTERSTLADYLSLMTIEIMGAAERTTLIDLVGSGVPVQNLRSLLEDSSKRRDLLSKLPNGLSAALVWSIQKRWSMGRYRYRLRLSLHDGSSSFEDSKRLLEERGRLSVKDRSLKEFYEHGSGPYGDDGLGWYYLSFLGEECQKMGVSFEASVRESEKHGTAAVDLVIIL
ncbi:hypothetical protein MASR2M78_03240 [Treponema sp.]